MFADRPRQELELLARNHDFATYAAGDELVREGCVPISFNVILEGHVELGAGGRSIARLWPGDCTDYYAMRTGVPARSARAATEAKVPVAGHAQFQALMLGLPSA
jgi:CRP-like cAMP-binding protein